jgi:formylglycine-generating enzyme required for sulfatase activity
MHNIVFSAIAVAGLASTSAAQCAGDLFVDTRVDGVDLGVLLAYWGEDDGSSASSAADLNADGFVDGFDLGVLLGSWGPCPARITSIMPVAGPLSGGTTVRILGQLLGEVTSVRFGQSPAVSVTIVGTGEVQAISPPGQPGAVDLVVSGQRGTVLVPGGFLYQATQTPIWATLVEPLPDPVVVPDIALRDAIAATGWAWRVRDNLTQIELLLVPPGSFQMGCSSSLQDYCSNDERPVHPVTLTSSFYLSRFEVTQSQWQLRMGSNPSQYQGMSDSPSRPVERVSWSASASFASSAGMRLPTEAEWEFACRAGTTTAFNSGSDDASSVGSHAWFSGNSGGQTRPVGQRMPNRLGFHDMHGNVSEWTSDWYSSSYYWVSPIVNPTGPVTGAMRVARGGSFEFVTAGIRSSSRQAFTPATLGMNIGLRVARNP